jgi:hypothetical protein
MITNFDLVIYSTKLYTIPGAAGSMEWVCGRSLDGIAGSTTAGGMDVSLVSVVCCQVEVSATG